MNFSENNLPINAGYIISKILSGQQAKRNTNIWKNSLRNYNFN